MAAATKNGKASEPINRIASLGKGSKAPKEAAIVVTAPNFQFATFRIVGTAPYVMHKFSAKARKGMMDSQVAGSQSKSRKIRAPKDFDAECEECKHISDDGWCGIPAPAFRSAMIDACRLVGFKMTIAKQTVFVEADGFSADDGTPLVQIHGEPIKHEATVRLANGVASVCIRPMWKKWHADVTIKFDADAFSLEDVTNLLQRAGTQVGIGDGRPFSKVSHGQGWGTFEIKS